MTAKRRTPVDRNCAFGALFILSALFSSIVACRDADNSPPASASAHTARSQSDNSAAAKPTPSVSAPLPPLAYLPPLNVPPNNPLTRAKTLLGKLLFFDPRLGAESRTACTNCHDPDLGWADGQALSLTGRKTRNRRHTPSLYNAGYKTAWLADGRANSLEKAIELLWHNQMGVSLAVSSTRIAAIAGYRPHFRSAFADPSVSPQRLVHALASFVRTIRSGNAPFDRQQQGDQSAISLDAKRGWQLFRRLGCASCHAPPLFSDLSFHNAGVGYDTRPADRGRAGVSGKTQHEGQFATPSLRGVSRHPPYLHDGSAATLDDAIDFMLAGGKANPNRDQSLNAVNLNPKQRAELGAFVRSLTAASSKTAPPQLP